MNWRKLNHLVPEPQCRTLDGVITEWTDTRPQPPDEEIEAVDMADVEVAELQKEEDSFIFPDVMITIAKVLHNHENRLRALEGKSSITLKKLVKVLRAL